MLGLIASCRALMPIISSLTPTYSGLLARMITNVSSALTTIGSKFRNFLSSQANAISERRCYTISPETGTVNLIVKRQRSGFNEYELKWLDRDGLNSMISHYHKMKQIFDNAISIVLNHDARPLMNQLLAPLLPTLADNEADVQKLRDGGDGHDLSCLFYLFCKNIFSYMDKIYQIGNFIKAKDNFVQVPKIVDYNFSAEISQTINRIQNILKASHLVGIINSILKIGGFTEGSHALPLKFIETIILDMTALQNNLIIPSYVMHCKYHDDLLAALQPGRVDQNLRPAPPGAYPDDGGDTYEIDIVDDHAHEGQQSDLVSPQLQVQKAGTSSSEKTTLKLPADETRSSAPAALKKRHFHHEKELEEIKKTYIADLKPRNPSEQLAGSATVKSILRHRLMPKPSPMTPAPKCVRFTKDTISPQLRSHMGKDVPRIPTTKENTNTSVDIKSLLVEDSGLQPTAAYRYKTTSVEVELVKLRQPAAFKYEATSSDDEMELDMKRTKENTASLYPQSQPALLLRRRIKDKVDHDLEIEKILALPSLENLVISDDVKAGLTAEKEKAAQKAAEEARRVAEEHELRQRQEKLAKTGGLRAPVQPLIAPLGAEWLRRVHATLRAAAPTTLATTAEGVDLRRHDFAKVVPPTEWLNDEIVNGSLNWLDQSINLAAGIKDYKKITRRCLAMSSFFFKRLQDQGVARTQRTLRRFGVEKHNILDVETILLPICEHSHWTLLVVRPSKKTITHMDSLNPRGSQRYVDVGVAWLKEMLQEQYKESEWQTMRLEAPLQTNGYDCGVHTITNGMCVALGLNPMDCYTSQDMPHQRLRLAAMLLNGGFKGDFDLSVF